MRAAVAGAVEVDVAVAAVVAVAGNEYRVAAQRHDGAGARPSAAGSTRGARAQLQSPTEPFASRCPRPRSRITRPGRGRRQRWPRDGTGRIVRRRDATRQGGLRSRRARSAGRPGVATVEVPEGVTPAQPSRGGAGATRHWISGIRLPSTRCRQPDQSCQSGQRRNFALVGRVPLRRLLRLPRDGRSAPPTRPRGVPSAATLIPSADRQAARDVPCEPGRPPRRAARHWQWPALPRLPRPTLCRAVGASAPLRRRGGWGWPPRRRCQCWQTRRGPVFVPPRSATGPASGAPARPRGPRPRRPDLAVLQ